MADTFYAWTVFRVPDADQPNNPSKTKVIQPGDKISPGDLGLDADSPDWEAYLDNGAVRTMEHPDMEGYGGSPVEYAKDQMAAMANEGGFFESGRGRVIADGLMRDSDGTVLNPEESEIPAPQRADQQKSEQTGDKK